MYLEVEREGAEEKKWSVSEQRRRRMGMVIRLYSYAPTSPLRLCLLSEIIRRVDEPILDCPLGGSSLVGVVSDVLDVARVGR